MSVMNYRGQVFKRIIPILSVVLLLGGCAGQSKLVTQPSEAAPEAETTQQTLALISNISVEEKEDVVRVAIKGSEPLTYEVTQMDSPLRLVVDVVGAKLAAPTEPILVEKGEITEIISSEFEKEGNVATRIEIGLKNLAHYEVLPAGNDLLVAFTKPLLPAKKAEKVLDFMIDDTNKDYVQVDIIADGTIENCNFFTLHEPSRLVIDFPELSLLVPVKEKKSTGTLLKKARWGEHDDYLRLVFDFSLSKLPVFDFIPTAQGASVLLGTGFEEKKSQIMSTAPLATQQPESLAPALATKPGVEETAEAKTEEPQKEEGTAPEIQGEAQPATQQLAMPVEQPAKAAETTPGGGKTPPETAAEKSEQKTLAEEQETKPETASPKELYPAGKALVVGEKAPRYTGAHISLDFKDADINNILRLIAEVSDLNIVAGEDVKGTVTIKLQDVPWDQALDVILLSNNLGKTLDGNILRIAPLDKLASEKKAALALQATEAKLEPLQKGLIPVSYAQAKDLKSVILNAKVLSGRGNAEVDQRTNTLVIIDTEKNIEEVRKIVEKLDTPTPQVLIEAKIIQIIPTYTKELGVSWGGDYTTGVSGGTAAVAGTAVGKDSSGNVTTSDTVLDLVPAAVGAGTGASLAIGYFRNNFNIFNKIAALETDNKVEILSNPRVMTLDNQEALVEQGIDVPYKEYNANITTATTQFKKATLSLKVIPHVTSDQRVMMEIEAKKDQISAQSFGTEPGIDTRRATTKVLVPTGETVVIGGIYEETKTDNYNSVPFFGRVPILSFFFRGTTKKREKTELIIFITPTIIQLPTKAKEVVVTPIQG